MLELHAKQKTHRHVRKARNSVQFLLVRVLFDLCNVQKHMTKFDTSGHCLLAI